MIKNLSVISILLIAIFSGSCRDDLEYRQSADTLRFSRDTVFLDTVFNGLSSSTYNLKVYNTSNDDISIPEVYLNEGDNSDFRLNVNGNAGRQFSNVEIPARDSIYIFVESTTAIETPPSGTFLATDAIVFTDGRSRESVQLVTLVQDAVFLFPDKINGIVETIPAGMDENGNELHIEGFELGPDQLTFTAEKPYVIYGYAAVPSGQTLEIQAGARVHFHEASGLMVMDGASLQVKGEASDNAEMMEGEVIFEGDRLEPEFSDIPGQWGTIWLAPGSTANHLDHLTIKNATIGLFTEGDTSSTPPKLILENTSIVNSASINLLARATSLKATNTLTGNSGQPSVYLTRGGSYEFTHCTIANYWRTGLRSYPALLIDNFEVSENEQITAYPLVLAAFNNCIISGNGSVEFLLNRRPEADFNFNFNHSLLQFNTTNTNLLNDPLYDFSDESLYTNILLNQDADLQAPDKGRYEPGPNSPAIDLGDPFYLNEVPLDIQGNARDAMPDAGAFEFIGN